MNNQLQWIYLGGPCRNPWFGEEICLCHRGLEKSIFHNICLRKSFLVITCYNYFKFSFKAIGFNRSKQCSWGFENILDISTIPYKRSDPPKRNSHEHFDTCLLGDYSVFPVGTGSFPKTVHMSRNFSQISVYIHTNHCKYSVLVHDNCCLRNL